ncbi:MAG TPA: T9SS type A sorting domain-containing protein, partial [Bacteroidia bacterium]|nr:T9SS type A sorting domain-containing protein [Bacteroidia bacterium]
RVNVINNAAAAVSTGNITSYVEGYLKRSFSPAGGIYDFPVGTSLKGYQRINFDFGSSNDRTNATLSFNNTAPATPTPFLGPECTSALYDQTPLNHGYWQAEPVPTSGVAPYTVTAYNNNFTNPQTGYTVMYKSGAGAWGLSGSCVPASIIGAVQRSSMTALGSFAQFAIAQSLTPLPVELLYLVAVPGKNSINLKWATASETMNKGFEIHRSENPPSFKNIGWQIGHGTTSSLQEYFFQDFDVEKNKPYYYRLNQVDDNGQTKFSEIVMATLTGKGHSLVAMPNPYVSSTNLSLTLTEDADVYIEIVSALGEVVSTPVSNRLSEGSYVYEFSAARNGWSKGVYMVKVKINEETSFVRLMELE